MEIRKAVTALFMAAACTFGPALSDAAAAQAAGDDYAPAQQERGCAPTSIIPANVVLLMPALRAEAAKEGTSPQSAMRAAVTQFNGWHPAPRDVDNTIREASEIRLDPKDEAEYAAMARGAGAADPRALTAMAATNALAQTTPPNSPLPGGVRPGCGSAAGGVLPARPAPVTAWLKQMAAFDKATLYSELRKQAGETVKSMRMPEYVEGIRAAASEIRIDPGEAAKLDRTMQRMGIKDPEIRRVTIEIMAVNAYHEPQLSE